MVDAVGSNAAVPTTEGTEGEKKTVTQMIQKMKAEQFKRFYLTKSVIDKTNHHNYIIK